MILYIFPYLYYWGPFWPIYVIKISYIVWVMYILQELDHILTKLLKSFLVGFEIYVAIDLIGGPTQSNLSLGLKITGSTLCPGFILYFLDMSIESTMSLSFSIGLVVKPLLSPGFFSVVVTGRSVTKIIKIFPISICNDRKRCFVIICFFFFFFIHFESITKFVSFFFFLVLH